MLDIAQLPKVNNATIVTSLRKAHPDIYREIFMAVCKVGQHDLSKIKGYYGIFNIEAPVFSRHTDKRRAFFALMLKIYQPSALNKPVVLRLRQGFLSELCDCCVVKAPVASRDMREAIVMYHAYEDFRKTVDDIYLKLNIEDNGGNKEK